MSTTLGIKLDDATKQRLKALAEKRDRTPHWLMKQAIEEYLQQAEKYEAEKYEDQKRWDNYVATDQTVDNKAVNDWISKLGLRKTSLRPGLDSGELKPILSGEKVSVDTLTTEKSVLADRNSSDEAGILRKSSKLDNEQR